MPPTPEDTTGPRVDQIVRLLQEFIAD